MPAMRSEAFLISPVNPYAGAVFPVFAVSSNGSNASWGVVLRFAGFELDQQRAELRRPDGRQIKLRPKTFEMLRCLRRKCRPRAQQA